MKKYMMLGVNGLRCCILSCLIPFNNLIPDEIEASDFNHRSTNWCGYDYIGRTLDMIEMKQTGNVIVLDNPIVFQGQDYDWGHSYEWLFTVNEIHELSNKKQISKEAT